MNSILYTTIMVILWIVNLFNGTGLGEAYQTTERARVIIYIIFVIIVLVNYKKKHCYVKRQNLIILGSMSCLFIFDSYIQGYGMEGLNYISVFALVYILSKMETKEKAIRLTGIVYLVSGIVVLYTYNYGTVFSGWNPNTIGMIALYSYLIYLIPFYNYEGKISGKIIITATTILYIMLIAPTDSRSCIWFSIVAILIVLSIIPRTAIAKADRKYVWLLLIPLFVAVFVVGVSKGNYMTELNLWSIKKFEKPLFNGRDILWEQGFQSLFENFLFGTGSLEGNWHNCLVSIATAYGFLGGLLWVMSLRSILSKAKCWINDAIVSGCIISFAIIYIQQSVELGLVHESPNILPYIVVGMMLGRVKFLNKLVKRNGRLK